jgi:glutamate/tyrosine decarboxylase-like PLP-dependent enzyme
LTIGLDAHKTGQLPYSIGIFLCRKNLQQYIETDNEIYPFNDDTLIGIRSGIPALLGKWYVDNYLIPSMLEQGIQREDILVYNDNAKLGNLRAFIASADMVEQTSGT